MNSPPPTPSNPSSDPTFDPQHPGSGPAQVQRSPVAPGAELPDDDVPRQPRERDESIDATADAPDPRMLQAQKDLAEGQMDTDMRVQPGLDAERRRRAVGGPAGQENPPRGHVARPSPTGSTQPPPSNAAAPDPADAAAAGLPQGNDDARNDPPVLPRARTAPLSSQPPAASGGTRSEDGSDYGTWVPERTQTLHPDLQHTQDLPLAPPPGNGTRSD